MIAQNSKEVATACHASLSFNQERHYSIQKFVLSLTITTFPSNLYRIHAVVLIEPLLPRSLCGIRYTFSPLVQTRPIPLIIFPLKLQPLMRKFCLFRAAVPTTKSPLLLQRRTMRRDRARVRTRILARHRPPPKRGQETRLRMCRRSLRRLRLRLFAETRQTSRRFTLSSRPGRLVATFPEQKAAEERPVASLDVMPGPFAPAEDADVDEAHARLAERGQQREGENRMLRVTVAVAHAVDYERDQPHGHVDDGVDEENS